MKKPLVILGVDPGTLITGYSIITVSGNTFSVKLLDVLKLPAKEDNYQRLNLIYQCINQLILDHRPDAFAIEAPFFAKNVQSMLKLGRAQGVAIAAAMSHQVPVSEYAPRRVKQSITGKGNASKEQVWEMLQRLTGLTEQPKFLDASDALAVALCHHFGNNALVPAPKKTGKRKPSSSWEKFIQENQHRLG